MPAGSLGRLKTALLYGADAVYAGTPDLSLRTHTDFPLEDLAEGIGLAHGLGRRVYLTLNLFTHNRDVEKLPRFIELLRELGPDGVIVSDPGVFQLLKDEAPELERHISTQANAASWLSVDYWRRQGAALCVLAREVSFEELAEIRHRCPQIRLETFVHGAMCMTYSGRCLLSNYLAERGSNQGSCAHSCRWKYKLRVKHADGGEGVLDIDDTNMNQFRFFLEEEFRPGELYPIEEDERGSYILNSRDLCLMPKLNEYLALGIDSLKVEGRNKNEYYVATVTRAYRNAIDAYYTDPQSFDPEPFMAELATTRARGFTLGFHTGRLSNLAHDYVEGQSQSEFEFAGFVREWESDALIFEVRNRLLPGAVIEFLPTDSMTCIRLRLYAFEDAATGEQRQSVSAGQGRAIRIPLSLFHLERPESLWHRLPAGSVGRQRATLDDTALSHLRESQRSYAAERELLPAHAVIRRSSDGPVPAPRRRPALGAEGCCGLGCNGCLMFWQEPRYEAARSKLQATLGERLRGPVVDLTGS